MSEQKAILLLHGFTGGPFEVMPLAEHLSSLGWHGEAPTLPGHDRPLKELDRFTYMDWIRCSEEYARTLSERFGKFDLAGFSMGGLIAAYLANRFPVRRLILLNAAVFYVSPGRFLRNVFSQFRSGNVQALRVKRDTPIKAVLEFAKLVRQLKPEFSRLAVPTFVAQGEMDEIVHPLSAYYIVKRIQGLKELAVYPNSRHMICLEPDAPALFQHVGIFLTNNGNKVQESKI